jgi:hypothetical protein
MKMFEFKIVHGRQEFVESEVNTLAQQNWKLHGSIQMSHFNGGTLFTQTMVREKEIRTPYN